MTSIKHKIQKAITDPKGMAIPFKVPSLYTIEKNVPLRKGAFGRWYRLAQDMIPGDSVLVKNENECIGLCIALKRAGKKIRSGKEHEDSEVRRVWVIGKKK